MKYEHRGDVVKIRNACSRGSAQMGCAKKGGEKGEK